MTRDEAIAIAKTDALEAIDIARTTAGPIELITSNNFMPPLRAFGQAEKVWDANNDGDPDTDLWETYFETFESVLEAAGVYTDSHPDDGSVYVVDLRRWERIDDPDESETLSGEWKPRPPQIAVGDTATFTYPEYGTAAYPSTEFPEHTAHSGQTCTVIRELGDDERDSEVGRMFIALFADGAELPVVEDELTPAGKRPIISIGWDGHSHPMLRYTDEMHLPDHQRSIVSATDRPVGSSCTCGPTMRPAAYDPDCPIDGEVRDTPKPKPLGMPYWRAVPGGRKCPNCGEVVSTAGTKLNQAVYDHWATHEPTDADECADGCHHGDADDDPTDDRCDVCRVPEHDTCPLVPNCPCCADSIRRDA